MSIPGLTQQTGMALPPLRTDEVAEGLGSSRDICLEQPPRTHYQRWQNQTNCSSTVLMKIIVMMLLMLMVVMVVTR